ncbi:MAG: flagellar basal-body MS-ring/collar protein FliF [Buchnera aphidicola (Floraphis choui)]
MNVGFKHNSNVKEKNKKRNFSSFFPFNFRIVVTITSILSIIIFYMFFFRSSNYCVLYDNLSNEDEKLIISQLTHMNIPFKFNSNHSTLLVPESELKEAQFSLSEQGLPKGKSVGFELLDQEKFGISQFNEQINYQRALEGELARSIQQLDNVKMARIHIALPKPSLFVQDKRLPSASIILSIKPGSNLESNQINAILYMVSGSISGLSIENITIVDQKGRLLSNNDSSNNIDDLKLRYYNLIEERYKQRIENILIPLVGMNNVHAQVTAQINFDKVESTEEKYKPNYKNDKKSIRSHQSNTNIENNEKGYMNNIIPSGVISKNSNVLSNKSSSSHNRLDKHSDYALMSPKSNTNQDYIINYELDHTILHSKFQVGDVKRLSAAVVVNYIHDKNGDLVSLSPYQINKIENLIKAVIGFSAERGDIVSVVSSLFIKPSVHIYKNLSFWNKPLFLNNLFKYGLILIIVTMLYFLYKVCFFKKTLKKDKLQDDILRDKLRNNNQVLNQLEKDSRISTDGGFSNLSKHNSYVIAMMIRKWMSGDKK